MGSDMSRGKFSCAACCRCCCPDDDGNMSKKQYPHISYKTLSELQTSLDAGSEKPPLDKYFQLPQTHADFTVHPQLNSSSEADSNADVIAEQPHQYRPHMSLDLPTSRDSTPGADTAGMETQPTLVYSLYHDIQKGTLSVHLKQAFNLPSRRKNKPIDSYVGLYLLPHQHQVMESKVVRNSLNPVFEQEFDFVGQPSLHLLKKQTLVFKVFGSNKYSSADLMGVVRVKLKDADMFGETIHKKIEESSIEDSSVEKIGDVLFSLTYLPCSNSLQGTLLKAANLKPQDITGTADPYMKLMLVHKDRKLQKWKSTVKKHTLTPTYNEQFQFSVQHLDMNHVRLDFTLMDYDRFSRDDLMGVVSVGGGVADETGRAHWEELMSAPNQVISRWHPIMLPSRAQSVDDNSFS